MDLENTDVNKQDSSTVNPSGQDDTTKVEGQEVKNDRAIPYSRFKEKVEQVKNLEKQINAIRSEAEGAVNKTKVELQSYYESEIARIQRDLQAKANDTSFDSYAYDDDAAKIAKAYESKISSLVGEIDGLKSTVKDLASSREADSLKSQINSLKEVYPSMDEEHVYAIKKIKPDWSLDECAEYSHTKWEEKLNSKWTKMMEEKKQAAKKPIFGPSGKLNIKPSEKPKSLKEAKKMLLQWAEEVE